METLEVQFEDIFSRIKIPMGMRGRWSVMHEEIKKGHNFTVTSLRDQMMAGEPQTVIKAPRRMHLHLLREGGNLWMSDHPAEVWSHTKVLKNFKGRVLVAGLGLGVAVSYLESLPAVKEIVVIEKSPVVKALVWKHLKTKKSTIIIKDIFKYIDRFDSIFDDHFDHCFLDVWIGQGEQTLWDIVNPLRMAVFHASMCPNENVHCWKEDLMLGQVRVALEVTTQLYLAQGEARQLANLDSLDIFRYPEDRFQAARDALGLKWVFFNWARQTKPSKEGLYVGIAKFMEALANPAKWGPWQKYRDPV